jgi:hypothetical protein
MRPLLQLQLFTLEVSEPRSDLKIQNSDTIFMRCSVRIFPQRIRLIRSPAKGGIRMNPFNPLTVPSPPDSKNDRTLIYGERSRTMVIEIGAVYMEEVNRTGFHPCICWEKKILPLSVINHCFLSAVNSF